VALNSLLASKALSSPSSKLSEEGRKLVVDLGDVIKQAKYLLLTKNDGDLLQNFIWETQHLTAGDAKVPGAPTDKATAQQHGNQALEGMRTLGTLLISNGQFRKLLKDMTILIRLMVGDAAQNAANKVNPKEEQLSQLDEPAQDNTWHENPDFSRENLKNQAKSAYDKQKPFSKKDLDQATRTAADQQATTVDGQPAPADGQSNQQAAQAGGKNLAGDLKQQASANVPEETKQKGRDTMDTTRKYLAAKMPKERREQTVWRLKKMITEIQGHSDCEWI
jgi:hypothetical protein